jgi:peptidyl-prolyl cis-trans isomerase SurA
MNKIFFLSFLLSTLLLKAQEPVVLDEVIGVIGDEIATKAELESKFAAMVSEGATVTDNSRCEVLEDILYSKMLLNQAKLDSIEVTENQVESEMDRRLRYFIQKIGSEEALVEYYKKPISKIKDEMRSSLYEQLLIQGMQSEITADVKVTPAEVKAYYDKIPKDSLPLINAEVEGAHIVAFAPTSRASIKEVKEKLREYKQRVSEGEKFSTLAVLYSEDKGSAVKGGEIGFVGKAEVEPEFAAAAFQLKAGQVSPIIETNFGFHIIQMIERRGTKVNVRHILLKPKLDPVSMEKAKEKLDSVNSLIRNDSLTFEAAARKFSDDEDTRKNGGVIVNPYTASSMTPMDEIEPALFFVIDKMEIGEISEPVQIQDPRKKPGYRIIKLKKRTEPHRANLQDDYQRVKQAATSEKQQEVLMEWMSKAIKDTYLKIDKEYTKGCEFMQPWIEK